MFMPILYHFFIFVLLVIESRSLNKVFMPGFSVLTSALPMYMPSFFAFCTWSAIFISGLSVFFIFTLLLPLPGPYNVFIVSN